MFTWDDLKYWSSPEWLEVQRKLGELDEKNISYNPARENLFAALDDVPYEKVRVCILGQDPYPNKSHATGIAFSIPHSCENVPPTFKTIIDEYHKDLHYPIPESYDTGGALKPWVDQGVLLWNVIPSCTTGVSKSHDWPEWKPLTQEIIERLNKQCIVFAFLGATAREFTQYVSSDCSVIETGHPSPRGNLSSNKPFSGSRLFTTINDKLIEHSLEPINWRL